MLEAIKGRYNYIVSTPYVKSIKPFLKELQKLHEIAVLLFNNYLPEAQLTRLVKIIKDNSIWALMGASDVAGVCNIFSANSIISLLAKVEYIPKTWSRYRNEQIITT